MNESFSAPDDLTDPSTAIAESDQTIPNVVSAMNRTAMLRELLDWCNQFIISSRNWRRQSFEDKWHTYQRNSDAIYDPLLAARKEDWQSKAFMPLTPSHRETIQANIYKTMIGARPPLEMKARGNPQQDQSQNIRDILIREFEKSRFEIGFNGVLDDATTYGSGFCRIMFETKTEDRKIRVPQQEPINVMDPSSLVRAATGQRRVLGYQDKVQEVVTYRGVSFKPVWIWNVFPDPKATKIRGNAIAIRYPLGYGDVVRGVDKGYFFEESKAALKGVQDNEQSEDDLKQVKADRLIYETPMSRTEYDQQLKCFELYARLPKKWVYINGEQIDDPEKLVPARIIFHRNCVLAVELNDQYDGEPPIYKMDYMPVAGQFYGRGIPEMLKDLQLVQNEDINQRIDIISRVINDMYAVIETALVDSKDVKSKPGGVIRFDLKKMIQNGISDIRHVFHRIEMGTIDRSIFMNPQEMERIAQERTSANKVTLGTAGQTSDTNDTARGMLLLNQQANEKFAYVGMLIEFVFSHEVFRAYWKVIYSNINQQDVINAIGEQRAQTFQLLTPEQIEQDYRYEPQGIYTQESKSMVQGRLAAIFQQFAQTPWINPMAFFDKEVQTLNEEPANYKYTPQEMQQMIMAQHTMQQASGPLPSGPPPQPQATNGTP